MSRAHPLFRKWFMIFMAVVVLGLLSGGMAVGALIGYIDKSALDPSVKAVLVVR